MKYVGVVNNNINEVIEEDMRENPIRLRSGYKIIPVEINKNRIYREWEF